MPASMSSLEFFRMVQSTSRGTDPQAAAVQSRSASSSAKEASQQPAMKTKATENYDLSGFFMFADPL